MEKEKKEVILINEQMIQGKIYMVRGRKVMLDVDLAEIYGYETKRFNEQVKNNIEKFDEDFMFPLSKEDYHEEIPEASLINEIDVTKGTFTNEGKGFVSFVDVDVDVYRRKQANDSRLR